LFYLLGAGTALVASLFEKDDGIDEVVLLQVQVKNDDSKQSCRYYNVVPIAIGRVMTSGTVSVRRVRQAIPQAGLVKDACYEIGGARSIRQKRAQNDCPRAIPWLATDFSVIGFDDNVEMLDCTRRYTITAHDNEHEKCWHKH
jgi:hypothetical protein